MDLIDVLVKDHAVLRDAVKALERHLGPERACGWEDRVRLDMAGFHGDLERLSAALHEHERLEEKLVASRLAQPGPADRSVEKMLLERHRTIDSLLKLFSAAAELISDGRVHATRTILSRLSTELSRHLDEEERDFFPRLREFFPSPGENKKPRASSGA
jgi:hemerythrin-like domain-containing protein